MGTVVQSSNMEHCSTLLATVNNDSHSWSSHVHDKEMEVRKMKERKFWFLSADIWVATSLILATLKNTLLWALAFILGMLSLIIAELTPPEQEG